jgi:hypothetical protein
VRDESLAMNEHPIEIFSFKNGPHDEHHKVTTVYRSKPRFKPKFTESGFGSGLLLNSDSCLGSGFKSGSITKNSKLSKIKITSHFFLGLYEGFLSSRKNLQSFIDMGQQAQSNPDPE